MRRRLRAVIQPGEKWRWLSKLKSWGYPRELTPIEINLGSWFSYGNDSLFWIEPVPAVAGLAILHLAVAPETREKGHGSWARVLFGCVYNMADVLLVDRLAAADCVGDGVVAGYLQRLGWKRTEIPELEDEEWWVWETKE